MIKQSVAVKVRPLSAIVVKNKVAKIFTAYRRIQSAKISTYSLWFAKQVPEYINEMYTGFMNQKLLHVAKVGLACQIGVVTLTIARSQPEACLQYVAEVVVIDLLFYLPVPGLKAKVFMYNNRCVAVVD